MTSGRVVSHERLGGVYQRYEQLRGARTKLETFRPRTILCLRTQPFIKRYLRVIAHRRRLGPSICGPQCKHSHSKLGCFPA